MIQSLTAEEALCCRKVQLLHLLIVKPDQTSGSVTSLHQQAATDPKHTLHDLFQSLYTEILSNIELQHQKLLHHILLNKHFLWPTVSSAPAAYTWRSKIKFTVVQAPQVLVSSTIFIFTLYFLFVPKPSERS